MLFLYGLPKRHISFEEMGGGNERKRCEEQLTESSNCSDYSPFPSVEKKDEGR